MGSPLTVIIPAEVPQEERYCWYVGNHTWEIVILAVGVMLVSLRACTVCGKMDGS